MFESYLNTMIMASQVSVLTKISKHLYFVFFGQSLVNIVLNVGLDICSKTSLNTLSTYFLWGRPLHYQSMPFFKIIIQYSQFLGVLALIPFDIVIEVVLPSCQSNIFFSCEMMCEAV